MKILFLVPYVPNKIRVRPFNFIKQLAADGHQVTILTLWSEESEQDDLAALREFGIPVYAHRLSRWRSIANCLRAVPSATPLQAVYCWHPDLAREFHHLQATSNGTREDFDVIHIEHLRGVRYGLSFRSSATEKTKPPIVWDSVDSISHLFRQASAARKNPIKRWLFSVELARTEPYETWLIDQFSRVLVTSSIDKDAFLRDSRRRDQGSISVIPNGVDLDYFKPDPGLEREPATLIVSGKMSYHANVNMTKYLVHEIMPRVWSQRADVKLWVVGKNPPREIKAFGDHPAITVTGTVPDIRPFLQRGTIAVTPVQYGAGIQNKVLEAMACGTPVVSSSLAVSAISVAPDQDLCLADDPVHFAETLLSLLDDPEKQKKIGEAGRRFVETQHSWAAVTARLAEVYQEVST